MLGGGDQLLCGDSTRTGDARRRLTGTPISCLGLQCAFPLRVRVRTALALGGGETFTRGLRGTARSSPTAE